MLLSLRKLQTRSKLASMSKQQPKVQYRSNARFRQRCRPRHVHCGYQALFENDMLFKGVCMTASHADESSGLMGGTTGRSWRTARGTGGESTWRVTASGNWKCMLQQSFSSCGREQPWESTFATLRAGPHCGSKLLLAFVGALKHRLLPIDVCGPL